MLRNLIEIKHQLCAVDSTTKKNIFFLGLAVFLILLSYPLIRSASTAIFLQSFGAKSSPLVWVWSVLALSILVSFYNHFQLKWRIHILYAGTGLFSIAFILLCFSMVQMGHSFFAWPFYIWKEVYIVVMLHMVYGLLNTLVDIKIAKILYGPLGAIGSLGGVFGGLLTSQFTKTYGVSGITIGGVIIIFFSIMSYMMAEKTQIKKNNEKSEESPLASVSQVKGYTALMASIVILSQFVINLANFKFNVLFELAVPDQVTKTEQLGKLYTWINLIAFLLQILVLPFLLRFVSLKRIHLLIPIIYLATQMWTIGGGALAVASMFMVLKGMDYSIFAVSKELLYFPLTNKQKYGAKYIVDMFCYRFGKGLISFIMIYIQALFWIDAFLYTSLILWLVAIIPLTRMHTFLTKDQI